MPQQILQYILELRNNCFNGDIFLYSFNKSKKECILHLLVCKQATFGVVVVTK